MQSIAVQETDQSGPRRRRAPDPTPAAARPAGPAALVDVSDDLDAIAPPGRIDPGEVAALVEAAASGDQTAWNALVDRFAPLVWATARSYRLGGADAADVFQTTWLRLVEHLHRIEQPERLAGWLATTARRESLRLLRLAGRQTPTGDHLDQLADPIRPAAIDRKLMVGEQQRLLTGLVAQLPVRQQLLLRLLSADPPLPYRDISEALSMPIGSIGPTRARALEHLRRLATAAGYSPDDLLPSD